ncbi:MAG TPA: glycosyltransferase [Pricia antarctica]|uniref:Glycosyltransferase n=2 Tax=root TaxID=1 RepID=A0A831QRJ8_9FLAO|nr:glycosyltransferase [Pricia antarctica]
MNLFFSFIIPVYNRPDEIGELLESFAEQTYAEPFEIVIVEDGSTIPAEQTIVDFMARHSQVKQRLTITYLKKPNSGPGNSRNFGMARAKGGYFIILDSDCILPPTYLAKVENSLREGFVHCYGGPDAAHASFSLVQKAINYAMTAVLTTGGIRGNKRLAKADNVGSGTLSYKGFQPRSFNMGLSKSAFEATGGFGNIHPGEDPDLTFRIWEKGYTTKLIPEAYVFHKRRIDWKKFFVQVKKFGMVRPILNLRFPKTSKMTYWFPTFFCLGFLLALVFYSIGIGLPLLLYSLYFVLIFIDSLLKNRSLAIALLSLVAVSIQFIGYGYGFLRSTLFTNFSGKKSEELFPQLFFKKVDADVKV